MFNNFKEDLIKELGLGDLPEERKMEITLSVGRIIQQNIILKIIEELKTEKNKKDFDLLLMKKGNDEEAILKFLQSKISNLDGIINGEIEKFKKSSIGLLNDIMK